MNTARSYAEFFFVRDLPFVAGDHWDVKMITQGQEYYDQLREDLLTGPGELAEQVWTRHAAGVVDQWRKRKPGTRPLCWWRWDSPLKAIPERQAAHPHRIRTAPDGGYESEPEYLRRHRRLVASELKALERRA